MTPALEENYGHLENTNKIEHKYNKAGAAHLYDTKVSHIYFLLNFLCIAVVWASGRAGVYIS